MRSGDLFAPGPVDRSSLEPCPRCRALVRVAPEVVDDADGRPVAVRRGICAACGREVVVRS